MGAENTEENQEQEQNKFRIIKGKFKYGKYDDEVGMFMAVIGNGKLKSWNLVMTDNPESQLTPVEGDYVVFKRIFNENSIKEKQRSYKFKDQLRSKIESAIENNLFTTLEAAEEFFDQELHILAKEKIKLELAVEEVSEGEIRDDFPQLFVAETNNDQDGEEEEQEEILIDCSLVIAPITGKKLAQIDVTDEILVETSKGNYDFIKEVLPENTTEDGNLIAKIEEINYDEGEEVYQFLLRFNYEIFGHATIDANSNMKLAVPGQNNRVDFEEYEYLYNSVINLLLVVLAVMIILLIGVHLF